QAAGRVGRGGPYTGVFGGAAYDLQFRWTNIYLTDLGKQAEFLAAMVRQDPRIDTSLARFVQVAHTRLDCEAEQDRIMAVVGKSFRVFGVSCSSDSAVLGVGVDDTAAAGAFFADPANGFPAPGFRIEVAPGTPMIAVTG
ncbi:MAG: hypothetical protein HOU01_20875, partial [Streptomycetaceae bacterium]|nr:hypothetical protein [Streptomycetaceae bacterium]